MKKSMRIVGLAVLFVLSFLFFVWATFPYEVLKETLANQLSEATGMTIRIGDLGPKFPVGVKFQDISITSGGGPALEVKQVTASISPLALLIARASVTLEVVPPKGDSLEVSAGIGLISLLKGAIPIPKSIEISSNGLPIGPVLDFFLTSAANSPTANPLVAPLLKQIRLEGKLIADIDLSLNADNPTASEGKFSLMFKDAALNITGGSLNIPNQSFKSAKIEGQLAKAMFTFKDGSGLKSDDLAVDLGGTITLKQPIDRSAMALAIKVELGGPLKDNFGFLLDAASGAQSDGKISVKIDGTLAMPNPTMM